MSQAPRTNDEEAIYRAEWLTKHRAPIDWIILTAREVAELKLEFAAVTAERDSLAAEVDFLRPELAIANARLRGEVHPLDNGCLEPGVELPSKLVAEREKLRAALEIIGNECLDCRNAAREALAASK